MRFYNTLVIALIGGAMLVGCARINPLPITEDNTKTAKGIRYYEARPFIAVQKPYVLHSASYLVDALVTPDGKTYFITGTAGDTANDAFNHLNANLDMPGQALLLKSSGSNASGQSESGGSGDKTEGGGEGEGEDADKPATQPDKLTPRPVQTGTGRLAVATDLMGVGYFPVSDSFSIIYLPDFDREFAIDASPWLGITNISLVRGPGGMLLGMNSTIDNSAITGPLVDAYKTLVETGTKAAQLALRAATGLPAAQSEAGITVTRGDPELVDVEATPVTLRLHVTKFAAQGIYPIVKPTEVDDYIARTRDLQAEQYLVPVMGYQIPYKYVQIIVVEPLLDTTGPDFLSGGAAQKTTPQPPQSDQRLLEALQDTIRKNQAIGTLKDTIEENHPDGVKVDIQGVAVDPANKQVNITLRVTTGTTTKEHLEDRLNDSYPTLAFNVTIQ